MKYCIVILLVGLSCLIPIPHAISGNLSPLQLQARPLDPDPSNDTPPPSTDTITEADLRQRIETLEKQLAETKKRIIELDAQPDTGVPETLQSYETNVAAALNTYKRITNALNKKRVLEEDDILLRKKLEDGRYMDVGETPPFSLSFYNTLLDQADTLIQQKETLKTAAVLSRRAIEDISLRIDEVKKQKRIVKDQIEGDKDPLSTAKTTLSMDVEISKLTLAEAMHLFEKLKYQNITQEIQILDLKITIANRRKEWVAPRVAYDEADLQKNLNGLQEIRDALKERLAKLVEEREDVEQSWIKAQQALADEKEARERPMREREVAEREAWRKTYQTVIEYTEERLKLLDDQEENWRYRYALLKERPDKAEMLKQKEKAVERAAEINRTIHLQQKYQIDIQSQVVTLEKMIADQSAPAMKAILTRQANALRKLSERSVEYVSDLIDSLQRTDRLIGEIDRYAGTRVIDKAYTNFKTSFQRIWNFEVWVIDDRPVTVRKLAVGIIILIIGIIVAKFIIRITWRRVLKYASFSPNTAIVIEKVLYYCALFLIVLFVLRIVNIPLGAFAFFGGAIAIGIGFGAQNLINNFISGFIIMIEQPIRVGDLIETDGLLGQIEEIGARCTRIRTGDNYHILVPNSNFLEKNITNWTITDNKIRAHVTVGVAYGSPVREVRNLLLKSVSDHNRILNAPEPFVLFKDFGDSALIFSVYFWVNIVRLMERRIIESDIRFIIDKAFRENHITIAFPQMDVHLDVSRTTDAPLSSFKRDGRS